MAKAKEATGLYMEFTVKLLYGQYYYFPHNDLAKNALIVLTNRDKRKAFNREQVRFFKDFLRVEVKVIHAQEGEI